MGGVRSNCNSKGSHLPPVTLEEFWLQENLDKKGHLYSFGTEDVKLRKSATIATARHSSTELFVQREQAQALNESITKQAESISQIAKKQGDAQAYYEKNFEIS